MKWLLPAQAQTNYYQFNSCLRTYYGGLSAKTLSTQPVLAATGANWSLNNSLISVNIPTIQRAG